MIRFLDEPVFEVPRRRRWRCRGGGDGGAEAEAMEVLVREEMPSALPLEVPIGVGFGDNWLDAH